MVGVIVAEENPPPPPRRAPKGVGHPWPTPGDPRIFRAAPGDRDVAWRTITHRPPMTAWTDSHQDAPLRRGTPAVSLPAA